MHSKRKLCPYCRTEPGTTKEHIFPEFLGGQARIPACRPCNSTFGHTFEAAASKALTPLAVVFAANGCWVRKDIVWRNAISDPDTKEPLDLDGRFLAQPSRPKITKPSGEPKVGEIIARDEREAIRIARGLVKSGAAKSFESDTLNYREIPTPALMPGFWVDHNMRRLAAKVLIAMLAKFNLDQAMVGDALLAWLGGGDEKLSPMPYRMGRHPHELHDPESLYHFAYVEGSEARGVAIGYVRIFDYFSIYIELSSCYEGPNVAVMGTLDLFDKTESFRSCEPCGLTLPSSTVPKLVFAMEQILAAKRFDEIVRRKRGSIRFLLAPNYWSSRVLLGF